MVKHYSIKSFFRDMPAALLARYFRKQGHFQGFDFSALNAAKLEELFGTWLYPSNWDRHRINIPQFQQIRFLEPPKVSARRYTTAVRENSASSIRA